MRLPTEHGVAVALVVNELVMNALKHAQPASGPAIISVRLDATRQPAKCA